MSSNAVSARKRKPMGEVDVDGGSGNDEPQTKRTTRQGSTNASVVSTSSIASQQTTGKTSGAAHMEIIGALIQDLADSDNVKVNAALDALYLDLQEYQNKYDSLVTAGGCHALV